MAAARLGALIWASNQQEDPAAKEYWGDFASDNPKLDLLVLAIYDYCRAVTTPVPMVGVTAPKAYMNPQGFRMLCFLLGVIDVNYPEKDQKFMDFETIYNIHRKYYAMWNLPVTEVDDPMTGVKTPLISRKSMGLWIAYRMVLYPDESHMAFNKALKGFKLLHPFEEEPFEHLTIPRSCFAPTGNEIVPNSEGVRISVANGWPKTRGEILAAARQRGPSTKPGGSARAAMMMNAAARNAVNAQLQAANNVSAMAAASAGAYAAAQGSLGVGFGFATQDAGIF